jgi:hypothetical protein
LVENTVEGILNWVKDYEERQFLVVLDEKNNRMDEEKDL